MPIRIYNPFPLIYSYMRLFRWPNLLIVILTMTMVRYYLIQPVFLQEGYSLPLPFLYFFLLVLSVVLIAAGGYVINDYFDVRIDNLNEPERVVLGKSIPVKRAIILHAALTATGILLGFLVSLKVGNFKLVFVHLLAGLLLWLYSARYKRKPLWGNMIIALVSSLVVLMVWLFEFFAMPGKGIFIVNQAELTWVNRCILFVAGFSFMLTLVRELIKDMEDIEGDRRYGCRTLPVVLGIRNVKWITVALLVLSMIVMALVQRHLFAVHLDLTTYYFFVLQFMMGYAIFFLAKSKEKADFEALSQLARIMMVAGILALQIYYID